MPLPILRHAIACLFAIMGLLGGLGCKEERTLDGTFGEQGRLVFNYTQSCFFGCPLEQPLLVGSREAIRVQDIRKGASTGNAPGVEVRSSNPSVAEVALERQCYCVREGTGSKLDVAIDGVCPEPWALQCENLIRVGANAAGTTHVELSSGGRVLDRAEIRVAQAQRARYYATLPDALGEEEVEATLRATAGDRIELRVELYDHRGLELLAPSGVAWRCSDDSVATLSAFLIADAAEIEAGREVILQAHTAGEATLVVDVPGLEAPLELEVEAP